MLYIVKFEAENILDALNKKIFCFNIVDVCHVVLAAFAIFKQKMFFLFVFVHRVSSYSMISTLQRSQVREMPHVLMARVPVGEESVALGVWHRVKFGIVAPQNIKRIENINNLRQFFPSKRK